MVTETWYSRVSTGFQRPGVDEAYRHTEILGVWRRSYHCGFMSLTSVSGGVGERFCSCILLLDAQRGEECNKSMPDALIMFELVRSDGMAGKAIRHLKLLLLFCPFGGRYR